MKNIAILGCTGSIGMQTLDIVRSHPADYKVTGLCCGSNADALIKQAREFDCKTVGIADGSKYAYLRSALDGADIYVGDDALTEVMRDADTVVIAVVGMIGLKAVLAALDSDKVIALANKESLVAGGELVMNKLGGRDLLCPVDSEHSAVWQCLRGEKAFKRIILTASGGPFLNVDVLDDVTPEMAVAHPNWNMGKKISVDSATMMNKCLEIIEARWLFNTRNIDYVIHPQSVVHSMVEFEDGSIKAQASFPDMRLPIQYALTYPEHAEREYKPIALPQKLEFYAPNENKFRAPTLAKYAIEKGGLYGAVLNAANEAAVRLFLERKIKFTQIVDIVENALVKFDGKSKFDEDGIYAAHKYTYDKIYFN